MWRIRASPTAPQAVFWGFNRKGVNFLLPTGSCVVPSLRVILREGEARTEVLVREQKRLRFRTDPKPTYGACEVRKGSTNDDCYLFVEKVTFCYVQRQVTIIWQDSKTPNEIPPLAVCSTRQASSAQTSASKIALRFSSLRMTQKTFIGYKVFVATT